MATAKAVSYRSQEKHTSQTSQSFKTSTSTTKRKFKSSDEDFASITPPKLITADVSSSHISSQKQSSSSESSDTVRKKTSRAWKKEVGKTTLFGNDLQKLEEGLSRATNYMLMTTDRKALHQIAEERAQEAKDFIELCSARPASFDIPLRPHTVWERMAVKLACVVQGSPLPDAKWYKDGIQIRPSITPGKYRIQNKYGLHSLEIARCDLDDSGEYSITVSNAYGEATSYANVLVNSYEGTYAGADEEKFPTAMLETEADFAKVFLPSFPQELESYFLSCTFSSPLPKYQQNVQWFRNGMPLKESKWLQMEQTQQSAFLIFPSVHKEDEGLYTIRIPTLTGYKEHSAYVFVRDAEVSTAGVPGSPLDVKCHDVNKDYLFLSWSPPSTDGETNIIGYYVERCEAGTNQWLMCNDRPVKECKFPVGHLTPGHAYQFRVRAVNQRGMSHPSKVTKPVTMVDPKEADRTMVIPLDDMKTITVTKDELEAEVTVPLPPTNVHAAEKKDSYVVLCWDEPVPRGREPLTYLIEKSLHGSKSWQLANMDIPVHSPRFVVSDLAEGKQYSFRVRAENKHGISEPSLPSEPISLGKISAPLPPPKKVVAYRDTKTSAVVRWDKLKDADDCLGYYVYCCECGTNDWKTVNNKPVTSDR
ncbi:myomesin-3-like isoform X1 [Protopterus annectens]|uniref:myomesin-3-like isoform X1 n=1 Tax=Protopterus annectens TaxID=7888 RepID=UPI001CFA356F|nr:myomesin-3-like isoform X1 [Protopterus annectens]XP_043939183.1 myomesin-3-like isoform X2 [Protopterus annectens]XP_043939192.1 myomesin-3-like isoform X1 [Protopterus annectens]